MLTRLRLSLFAFSMLVLATGVVFAQPTVPNTFSDGDIIRAQAMNENFQAVLDAALAIEGLPGDCAAGEFLSFDGTEWACVGITSGTNYSAGTGITITNDTIALAAAYRLPSCIDGNGVVWSDASSEWVCASLESYTAGTGLTKTNNTFEVDFGAVAAVGHTHAEYLPNRGPATFDAVGSGNELTIDQYQGEVALSTDGDVQVGSVQYASPRTSYYSVPPAAFTGRDEGDTRVKKHLGQGGACDDNGSYDAMIAPVHLPHGADIQSVTFHYEDVDASNNLGISLNRYTPSGFSTRIVDFDSVGTPGETSDTLNASGYYTVVDNQNYSYYVVATAAPATCAGINVRQVNIEYTITEAR